MNREEMKKAAVDTVVTIAKEEAGAVLKLLNTDEVKELLKAQMDIVIAPLEQEIKTTDSLWVKAIIVSEGDSDGMMKGIVTDGNIPTAFIDNQVGAIEPLKTLFGK